MIVIRAKEALISWPALSSLSLPLLLLSSPSSLLLIGSVVSVFSSMVSGITGSTGWSPQKCAYPTLGLAKGEPPVPLGRLANPYWIEHPTVLVILLRPFCIVRVDKLIKLSSLHLPGEAVIGASP